MKLELDLSPRAVRMIKALGALTGKNAQEISNTISIMIETGLRDQIGSELGIELAPVTLNGGVRISALPPARAAHVPEQDTTGISDGLGDVDEDEGEGSPDPEVMKGLAEMDALVPTSGGLSDDEIAKDMEIDDKDIEAKVDAGTFGDKILRAQQSGQSSEDIFSSMAGLPSVPEDDRASRRKKGPTKSRGKVTSFSGVDREASL